MISHKSEYSLIQTSLGAAAFRSAQNWEPPSVPFVVWLWGGVAPLVATEGDL